MREAAEDNWERGRLWRGGSTITQQLVKNLFLPTFGSLLRKVLEIPAQPARRPDPAKDRILELYLNVVEWGPGIYGGEDAAQHYYEIPGRFSQPPAGRPPRRRVAGAPHPTPAAHERLQRQDPAAAWRPWAGDRGRAECSGGLQPATASMVVLAVAG